MERVGELINKLKEQFEQQAGADKLAVTAQLLLAELQKKQVAPRMGSNVSVVLPGVPVHRPLEERAKDEKLTEEEVKDEKGSSNWLFDTGDEIPTLAHQHEPIAEKQATAVRYETKEVNRVLATETESLNERLKEERIEVMTALQDAPVRDLKKAIGINDRYLFVNELFRGDENMYERSIKTINAFAIYPEAQYWIQRELKVKLSWPDNSETVRIFDQLIKRRFS